MFCNHRDKDHKVYTPGHWAITDVCKLLRSL